MTTPTSTQTSESRVKFGLKDSPSAQFRLGGISHSKHSKRRFYHVSSTFIGYFHIFRGSPIYGTPQMENHRDFCSTCLTFHLEHLWQHGPSTKATRTASECYFVVHVWQCIFFVSNCEYNKNHIGTITHNGLIMIFCQCFFFDYSTKINHPYGLMVSFFLVSLWGWWIRWIRCDLRR